VCCCLTRSSTVHGGVADPSSFTRCMHTYEHSVHRYSISTHAAEQECMHPSTRIDSCVRACVRACVRGFKQTATFARTTSEGRCRICCKRVCTVREWNADRRRFIALNVAVRFLRLDLRRSLRFSRGTSSVKANKRGQGSCSDSRKCGRPSELARQVWAALTLLF